MVKIGYFVCKLIIFFSSIFLRKLGKILFDISFLHCSYSVGSVYPVNAIIGGVISQEVIKVLFFVFCHLPYSIVVKYFSLFSLS